MRDIGIIFFLLITFIGQSQSKGFREELNAKELNLVALKLKLKLESKPARKAIILNEIGLKYQKKSLLDTAIIYHRKALRLTTNQEEVAIAKNKIGIAYYIQGKQDSAKFYFEQSVLLFKDLTLKANALNNLAISEKYANNPDRAMECYLQALKIYKDLNATNKQVLLLNNISALHLERKNFESALRYGEEALLLAQSMGNEELIANAKSNIAVVWNKQGDNVKAANYLKEVVIFFNKIKDVPSWMAAYNGLAIAYAGMNQQDKELHIYQEILDTAIQYGYIKERTVMLHNIGATFEKKEVYDSAQIYVEEALLLAQNNGLVQYIELFYKSLSELYKKTGNATLSLAYKDSVIMLRDSINVANEELKMLDIEGRYKHEELSEKLKNKTSESANKSQKLLYVLIAVLLAVFIIFILFMIYRKTKTKSVLLENIVAEEKLNTDKLSLEISQKEELIKDLEFKKDGKKVCFPESLTVLTTREKEVLTLLSEGLKDQEIADKLFLSITTVRTHLRKTYVKIDARNRAEAVQFFNKYHLD